MHHHEPVGYHCPFCHLTPDREADVVYRDERVFDRPDDLDLQRDPNPHLAFGIGPHFCLGAHLARAELEICLQVLAERLPRLRLADDGGEVEITSSFAQLLRGPNRLPVRFD